jgi:hypothetical protein
MSSDPSGRKGYRRIAPSSVRVRFHIRHHKLIGIRALAEARGLEVLRRADASAYALLGCDPGQLHAQQAVEAAE